MSKLPPETGQQTIDRMVAEPTLDRFFDSNPNAFTDDDFRAFIAGQRDERARIAIKKEKRKEEDDE